MKSTPDKSINYCKNGQCSRCCNCCGPVLPLSQKEIDKMLFIYNNNKKVHDIVEKNCEIKIKPDGYPEKIHLMCPFIDLDKHGCSIYSQRPQICRLYRCDKNNRESVIKCEYLAIINDSKDKFGTESSTKRPGVVSTFLLLDKPLLHNIFCLFFFRDDINSMMKKEMEAKPNISEKEAFEDTINMIAETLNLDYNTFQEAYDIITKK